MKISISIKLIIVGILSLVDLVKAQLPGADDDGGVTLANATLLSIDLAVVSKAEYQTILYGNKNLSAGVSELCIDSLFKVFVTMDDNSLLETNAEDINKILEEFFPELAPSGRHEFPGFNFVLFTPVLCVAAELVTIQTVNTRKHLCSQKSEERGYDLSTTMVVAAFRLLASAAGLCAPGQSGLVTTENVLFQRYLSAAQAALCELPGKPEIFHPP